MTDRPGSLGLFEENASTLFLAAGGLLIVFAALMGYQAFVDSSVNFADNEADIFGPTGLLFGFLGLIGLYPTLADRSPNLARVGAASAAVGVVGAAVIAIGNLLTLAGVLAGPPSWAAVLSLGILVGMIGGFPVFGIGCLRTGVHSLAVSLFLLSPVAIFVVMVSGGLNAVMDDAVARFGLASGQAASHLAIGITLRVDGTPVAYRGTEPSSAEVQDD
jgi:hypothetical protein